MSDTVKRALTAFAWRDVVRAQRVLLDFGHQNGIHPQPCIHEVGPEFRHGVAAQCLYGQPFGFTREDVTFLRDHAKEMEGEFGLGDNAPMLVSLRSLAARIEALLPPEPTT